MMRPRTNGPRSLIRTVTRRRKGPAGFPAVRLRAAVLKLMRGDERMIADTPIARPRNTSSKPVMARLPSRETVSGGTRTGTGVLAAPSALTQPLRTGRSIAPSGSGDARYPLVLAKAGNSAGERYFRHAGPAVSVCAFSHRLLSLGFSDLRSFRASSIVGASLWL